MPNEEINKPSNGNVGLLKQNINSRHRFYVTYFSRLTLATVHSGCC